jgi:NADH:ubiquinone oxidoreductase subunit 6 (subunit J)
VACAVGLLLMSTIYSTVFVVNWSKMSPRSGPQIGQGYNPVDEGNTARPIGMKLLGLSLEDLGTQRKELSSGYLLPFEIVSVHLLVVLVGAAYLARSKRRVDPTAAIGANGSTRPVGP